MSTKEDGIGSFSTKKSNIKNSIRSEENRPLMADYKNDLNPIIKKFNSEDRSTMVTTATTQSSSPMTTAAATVMNPTILKDQSKQIVFRTASHPVQFKPTATTIDEVNGEFWPQKFLLNNRFIFNFVFFCSFLKRISKAIAFKSIKLIDIMMM